MKALTSGLLIALTFVIIVVLISLAFSNETWTDTEKSLVYVFFFSLVGINQFLHWNV